MRRIPKVEDVPEKKSFKETLIEKLNRAAENLQGDGKLWSAVIAKLGDKLIGNIADKLGGGWEEIGEDTFEISDILFDEVEHLDEEALIAFVESLTESLEDGE